MNIDVLALHHLDLLGLALGASLDIRPEFLAVLQHT
jgi:hypothetical protein